MVLAGRFVERELNVNANELDGSLCHTDLHTIYCFHHAGGGSSTYKSWRKLVPKHVVINLIQLPGREERASEAWPSSMKAAAIQIADLIKTQETKESNFSLYGHSMGAIIAHSVCKELVSSRLAPAHLIVAAHAAPHLPREPINQIENSDKTFLQMIQAKYGGISDEIFSYPELLTLSATVLRNDLRLLDSIDDKEKIVSLDVPLTVFYGKEDSTVSLGELRAWASHTTHPLKLKRFPGGHFFHQIYPKSVVRSILETCRLD